MAKFTVGIRITSEYDSTKRTILIWLESNMAMAFV